MRVFYAILLILFLAAIVTFAAQNMESMTIKFLSGSWQLPVAALIAAVYLLGMLSGWTVIGMVRRSLKRVAEHREHH